MAKISARGATEVARIKGTNGDATVTMVITSDGRVLRKFDGLGGGYNVIRRGITRPSRDALVAVAQAMGYRIR